MRKFKLGYTTVSGNQKYLDCQIDLETGKILGVDGQPSFLITSAPETAKFIEIINASHGSKAILESTYDRLNPPQSRQTMMQSPVTLVIKTELFNGHEMQVGKLEPMFAPAIGVALLFLNTTADDKEFTYEASLLGFINFVDATGGTVTSENTEEKRQELEGVRKMTQLTSCDASSPQ